MIIKIIPLQLMRIKQTKKLTNILLKEAAKVRLQVDNKTNFINMNRQDEEEDYLTILNNKCKKTDQSKYLGINITGYSKEEKNTKQGCRLHLLDSSKAF